MNPPALEREFRFYQKNRDDFLSKYKGKYIIIKGEEVLDTYDDRMEAI